MSAHRSGSDARRYAIVCFGLAQDRVRRQPWHVACGLAQGLATLGHEVQLVTDAEDPPRNPEVPTFAVERLLERGRPTAALRRTLAQFGPHRVFLVTGALALARAGRLDLGAPVSLVMASPRFTLGELCRLSPVELAREWRLLTLPLVNALLPGVLLRRGFARSGASDVVYLSRAARERYASLGLPSGRLLRPQARAMSLPTVPATPARIGYFGPALGVRGARLALQAFEQAVEQGLEARLLLLLRPDAPETCTRSLLAAARRSHVWQRVEIETRMLDPAELSAKLASCTCFLLPFKLPVSEVPLAVIEAGLSGRPLVVLDAPGISEVAKALGATVAATPGGLASALLQSCKAPAAGIVDATPWTRWDLAVAELLEQEAFAASHYRFIGIAGVDGAGKTALADRLAERLVTRGIPCRRVWSRFRNYLSKPLLALARLTGHNRKETVAGVRIGYHDFARCRPLALAFLALQVADQLIDMALRFHGRRLIVADRCVLDTLVDLAVDTGLEPVLMGRLGRFLLRRLPAPRLVIVLERNAETIRATRPDALADRNLDTRRRLYARAAEAFGLPVLGNDRPLEETLAALVSLMQEGEGAAA